MENIVLRMEGISKIFPGVKALDKVDLNVYEGKVMALLGENGAGKSTLVKILSGVYQKSEGELYFNDKPLVVKSTKEAMIKGISIIHQELNLIEELSIAENIFIGRTPAVKGVIKWKELFSKTSELLKRLNLDLNPKTLVKDLSIGHKQMVEIAKALSFNAKIIIMDEPTDALTSTESESLFEVIKELKKDGKSIVYISHRLPEIFKMCDYVTVLRDGKFVSESVVSDIDEDTLIEMMVGRKLDEQYPYVKAKTSDVLLRIENLNNKFIKNINFSLMKGEILGVAGLMGAGRTELAKSIYGAIKINQGKIYMNNKHVVIKNETTALKRGIAYVSEDRKKDGLVLEMNVRDNLSLSSLKEVVTNGIISNSKESKLVNYYKDYLSIKTPSILRKINLLSGGNQQKVSIAKALACNPSVIIFDEPTRGVDVGAKKEIYDLMNVFKAKGIGIIMISSEIPEILGVCDRVMVMKDGEISGILSREDATQEAIMKLALSIQEVKNVSDN